MKKFYTFILFASLSISSFAYAEFASFQVTQNNNEVIISWSTSAQTASAVFLIQRSVDEVEWETIQEVQSAGESDVLYNYETSDTPETAGMFFYRVTEMDFAGTTTHSPSGGVLYGYDMAKPVLDISSDHINLVFSKQVNVDLKVYGITGNLVEEKKVFDERIVSLETSSYPTGIYILYTTVQGITNSKKIYIR